MEIYTVGGYSEVGKNMTIVKVNNEAIILDMGLLVQKLVNFEEEGGDRKNLTTQGLIKLGAIPNDNIINFKDKVKAIVLGHGHLDHLGATQYLAPKYNAPIIGTPYTCEVLKTMLRDDKTTIKNEIKTVNPNSKIKIGNIEIELI